MYSMLLCLFAQKTYCELVNFKNDEKFLKGACHLENSLYDTRFLSEGR